MVIKSRSCFTKPKTGLSKPVIEFACQRAAVAVTVIRENGPLN